MPKYSVIVPVYNVEDYLEECLDSVLAQATSSKYEIILIDDGSKDGSGVICDRYAEQSDIVRVVHTENRGVSCARNLAVTIATGTYILFLDSDDIWEQGLLEELDRMSETDPDVMVFGNSRLLEDGSKEAGNADKVIAAGESGKEYLENMFACCALPRFYSCCYAMRRTLLQDAGISFREDLKVSEDFDYLMRLFAAAGPMVGTRKPLYVYRMRQGSASVSITEKKLMDNLTTKADYFRKYPVGAMANIYADNALLVSKLPRKNMAQALAFLKENRDIWNHVSQAPLKLGHVLIRFFGDYNGAALYHLIRKIVRNVLKK